MSSASLNSERFDAAVLKAVESLRDVPAGWRLPTGRTRQLSSVTKLEANLSAARVERPDLAADILWAAMRGHIELTETERASADQKIAAGKKANTNKRRR